MKNNTPYQEYCNGPKVIRQQLTLNCVNDIEKKLAQNGITPIIVATQHMMKGKITMHEA